MNETWIVGGLLLAYVLYRVLMPEPKLSGLDVQDVIEKDEYKVKGRYG